MLVFIPDCCKKKMCNKDVANYLHDDFLPTLKFVRNWFVTSKMLEKLDKFVFSNDDLDLDDII